MMPGMGWDGSNGQEPLYQTASQELLVGSFVGRQVEQARFREMLLEMIAPTGKGLFGSLFAPAPRKPKNPKDWPIKSRVFQITGPAGSGKTSLTLRLAEITRTDKEFSNRFRTLRLAWAEVFERDNRLTARLEGEQPAPDVLLDLIHNHCLREDGEPYFEPYLAAIEETRTLAKTVQGQELEAVWRYRAQALGKGLREWSYDRPLLFFFDDLDLTGQVGQLIYPAIFEETGSQFFAILSGEPVPPDLVGEVRPERYAMFRLEPASPAEFKALIDMDLQRYRANQGPNSIKLSPDLIGQLMELSEGFPLGGRLVMFLLQSGLSMDELKVVAGDSEGENLPWLAQGLVDGPLGKIHPDRLKLYALAVLRQPEPGLLAALFDLRKDMLDFDETLERFNQRYAFLFEPGRQMSLHSALLPIFRRWLAQPDHRTDPSGPVKVNQHGLEYLDIRLQEWGASFSGLTDRLNDLKWREWALDKMWHSFWISEEQGWPVALSLLVAGLGLRPVFARQVTALLESIAEIGLLDEKGRQRLAQFRETVTRSLPDTRPTLRSFRMMGEEGKFFERGLPQFAPELAGLIDGFLK